MDGIAGRSRREMRRLLDIADLDHALPSTLWDLADSGSWRTGIAGDAQPAWQAAAHTAGSVTVWRTYTSEDGHALEVQIVQLASPADAADALTSVSDPARRLRRGGSTADDDQLEVGTTGAYLVLAFGAGDAWEPTDLAAAVTAQVAKLR